MSLLVAIFLTVFPAAAQESLVPFQGRVLDQMSGPVSKARVVVVDFPSATATTGADGAFSVMVRPGNHILRVEAEGFTTTKRDFSASASSSKPVDIVLQINPRSDAITVTEAGRYVTPETTSATKTLTPLLDTPQSVTVVSRELMQDQMMSSIADVVRYVPGVTSHQGENNRDQLVIRGNSTSADFFVNGIRDDVQYYRDLYNLERVEALKGPNALIFGRGGAGGVINRVTKEAGSSPLREFTFQGGSFQNKRFAADLNQPLSDKTAVRLNAMFEDSDTFRDFVGRRRSGVSPSFTWLPSTTTKVSLNYEHFRDRRTADRGVPLVDAPYSAFFGNPNDSKVGADVDLGSAYIEHQIGRLNLHNRLQFGNYDRSYQNYVPGIVNADRSLVSLSAYNNATARLNIFNQSEANYTAYTGRIRHSLLAGVEVGRQFTENFRNTGFFNNTATAFQAPYANAAISTPVIFRQSATDADNDLHTNLAGIYLQDQIDVTRHLQFIAGIRFDRFDLQYHNRRNEDRIRRIDNLFSPRAGIVLKPIANVSLFGSYSVSHLPSSGDQFSSLTVITQQVKPERFYNYEAGVKWDLPRSLALTAAVYRLDRTNTRSTDPNDPTRIVQTGSQRSNGFEVSANGRVLPHWRVAGGYNYQDVFVTSATAAARSGAQVAQSPHHAFSLWNHYQLHPRLSGGLGVTNRSDMFAAIDNTIVLPGYTRADAAIYVSLTERVRFQANVDNITDRRFIANADNNTNISPGAPRTYRAGLIVSF